MPYRKNLSRLAVASLLAAAVSAPAASAMPADNPRQQDMHASTVEQATPAGKDLRGERAKDAAIQPQTKAPAYPTPKPEALPGPPTWPENPEILTPPAKVVVATDGDGGGADVDWPVAILALGGTLLAGAGLGVAGSRMSKTRIAH